MLRRLYLVRHADAGDREAFDGDDCERPLSERGRRQSEQLALALSLALGGRGERASRAPERILSSPALRCRETAEPLAARLGAEVEAVEWLAEGRRAVEVMEKLAGLDARVAVAATHGDVVWSVLEQLARGGVELSPRAEAKKASTWILDWAEGGGRGVPVRATYLPPPRSRR